MYYLFSLKLNAWVGKPTYTSDLQLAKEFDEVEAFRRARDAKIGGDLHGGMLLVPVRVEDVERVLAP